MRIAWMMQLKPGSEAEYKRRHDEIWPEMLVLMQRQGVRRFSIYRQGLTLFACQERDSAPVAEVPPDPLTMKWWQSMASLMECNADASPRRVPLEEMFHAEFPSAPPPNA
jgi:L-rhamnose mutarotase